MSTSRALQDLRGDREEDEGGEVDGLADENAIIKQGLKRVLS